jgi:hypothetical protein
MKIVLSSERFRCPELLFNPVFDGLRLHGIHRVLWESIGKCDEEVMNHLCENIGGEKSNDPPSDFGCSAEPEGP